MVSVGENAVLPEGVEAALQHLMQALQDNDIDTLRLGQGYVW